MPEPAQNGDRPTDKHQSFVFGRLLDEIYLLIDFIATRDDRGLDCLEGCVPMRSGEVWGMGSKRQVLERVAELRFPPPNSPPQTAVDAAFLMMVKDRLTVQARPASGMTIAFTEMVLIGGRHPPEETEGTRRARRTSRRTLAYTAYPELWRYACATKWIWIVCTALLLLLALATVAATMGAENGRSMLNRLAAANRSYAEAVVLLTGVERQEARGPDMPGPEARGELNGPLAPPYVLHYCDRAKYLTELRRTRWPPADGPGWAPPDLPLYENTTQRLVCPRIWDAEREIAAVRARITVLLGQWRWSLPLFAPAGRQPQPGAAVTPSEDTQRDNEWRAEDAVNLVTRHVLPLCFTVLGAGVSILRDFSRRMHESRLAPRDLPLAFSRLALGVAAGLAVGLFQAEPIMPAAQLGGVAPPGTGAVALSAQALAFLAGYGLDAVFVFLDNQLARLRRVGAEPVPQPVAKP